MWIVQPQDDGDVRSGLVTDPEGPKVPEGSLPVRHELARTSRGRWCTTTVIRRPQWVSRTARIAEAAERMSQASAVLKITIELTW